MRPLSDRRSLPPSENIEQATKKRKPQKEEARGGRPSPPLLHVLAHMQRIISKAARTLDLTVWRSAVVGAKMLDYIKPPSAALLTNHQSTSGNVQGQDIKRISQP